MTSTAWKFPSPTWPTIIVGNFAVSRMRRAPVIESLSREIGTQVSVEIARLPGRTCRHAK